VTRERFLALLRLQIRQELRSGVGYWCAPDLKEALRSLYTQQAPLPAGAGAMPPRAGTARSIEGGAPAPSVRDPLRARIAALQARDVRPPAAGGANTVGPPSAGSEGAAASGYRFARPPAHLIPSSGVGSNASSRPSPGRGSPDSDSSAGSSAARKVARPAWGPPPLAKGRDEDWEKKLAAIEREAKGCTRCGLREGCSSVVFGVGGAAVPLVFVGEAPGAEEDRQGVPFVGRAGELLTRIVEAIGLKRDQVYICNVLKCRPPGNRDPHPEEVATCSPFLTRQLALLKPKVICTLGRHSTLQLTGQSGAMKNMRGQVFEYGGAKVIPTYHPAALLRNPALKPLVWEDVQKVRAVLDAE
jgi:uracil-DNA glycosylase